MKKGDLVFFYHSSTKPQAIVGICEVVREGYPDDTALDPKSEKEPIARTGGNADAKGFLHECIDEIEPIVRNRKGREKASTVKNPSAQSAGLEKTIPATAPKGNAKTSKNHDRISIPMSLRKFRTLSP